MNDTKREAERVVKKIAKGIFEQMSDIFSEEGLTKLTLAENIDEVRFHDLLAEMDSLQEAVHKEMARVSEAYDVSPAYVEMLFYAPFMKHFFKITEVSEDILFEESRRLN